MAKNKLISIAILFKIESRNMSVSLQENSMHKTAKQWKLSPSYAICSELNLKSNWSTWIIYKTMFDAVFNHIIEGDMFIVKGYRYLKPKCLRQWNDMIGSIQLTMVCWEWGRHFIWIGNERFTISSSHNEVNIRSLGDTCVEDWCTPSI